jgi:hypothetical protein
MVHESQNHLQHIVAYAWPLKCLEPLYDNNPSSYCFK